MKNLILKVFVLMLLPLIPLMGISNAEYFDKEDSSGYMKASSLDFTLLNNHGDAFNGKLFNKNKLKKDESINAEITVFKTGDINFYYYPDFRFKSGDKEVCEVLQINTEKEQEIYSSILSEFNLSTASAQITGVQDVWKFEVTHNNSNKSLEGKKCEFEIVFLGSQNSSGAGFSDSEKVKGVVSLAYEPLLNVSHDEILHKFISTLSNIKHFTSFEYELTYDTDSNTYGVNGSELLSGQNSKTIENLLGTCSMEVCTYHLNPHNFNLDITLTDIDGDTLNLSKQL